MRRVIGGVVVCVLWLSASSAFAQQARSAGAAVVGVVADTSGGAVAGATVAVVVAGRTVTTVTSGADGRYRVEVPAHVPVTLQVRRDGFAEQIVEAPGGSGDVTRNVTLAVGRVSDTLVVTAARAAESRANVTQSVTVMTRSDIEAIGATQLTDVLRFIPGLSVEGTGREGALTSLFARGGDSDYNVVIIDGVRANLDGGRFDFSRIAAGEIERVEVVRGAQSSLWGADAMGSVVQIFTRRAGATDAPRLTGSVESGSFKTFRGNSRVTGGIKQRVDYQAGVTYRRTDGAFGKILTEKDWFEQTAFDGAVGATLGSRVSVRTGVRYSYGQGRSVGPIAYGARDTGGSYDTKDLTWYGTATHTIGRKYSGTGTLNYFKYRSLSTDGIADPVFTTYAILAGTPNALFPNGTRLVRLIDQAEFNALSAAGATPAPGQFLASRASSDFPFSTRLFTGEEPEFRRPAFKYQGDYTWASGHRVSVGYDWERETSTAVAAFRGFDNNGVFIQQQSSVANRLFVTVGARVDRKESYDTFFSPRLSVGGFLLPFRTGAVSSVKVYGNIGKGIKAPVFSERFGGSGFADPNPDIKVERARSGDLGVEATFGDQRYRGLVTYFHNTFLDQISYRPGVTGDGIPEYINIDGSKASGWEIEAALQRPVAGVTAAVTYSYVDTQVVTNQSTSQQFQPGQPLLRRPRHSGTVRATYVAGRATVNVDVRGVGDRFDNSFLSLRTVPNAARPQAVTTDITVNPGYAVAGLGVDVRVDKALTLYLRADNLTDTKYDSALGYPGTPRSAMVGARFNIGR